MQVSKLKWLWEDFHKRREISKNLGIQNLFEVDFKIQLFTVNHPDIFSYQVGVWAFFVITKKRIPFYCPLIQATDYLSFFS